MVPTTMHPWLQWTYRIALGMSLGWLIQWIVTSGTPRHDPHCFGDRKLLCNLCRGGISMPCHELQTAVLHRDLPTNKAFPPLRTMSPINFGAQNRTATSVGLLVLLQTSNPWN